MSRGPDSRDYRDRAAAQEPAWYTATESGIRVGLRPHGARHLRVVLRRAGEAP